MALIGSLTTGASALDAFTQGIDVIGNDVANINTSGFKSSTVNYEDNFSQVFSQSSGATGSDPVSTQVGSGVSVADISRDFTQGNITSTGVTTDLAISGSGYFVVTNPTNGDTYATREGDFSTNQQGYLLTPTGQQVQGLVGGSINFTPTISSGQLEYVKNYTISPDYVGSIDTAYTAPSTTNGGLTLPDTSTPAGEAAYAALETAAAAAGYGTNVTGYVNANAPQLTSMAFDTNGNLNFTLSNGSSYSPAQVLLMGFTNQDALVNVGDNLYTNFDAAGPTGGTTTLSKTNNSPGSNGLGTFETESLEGSNVDLTGELTNLITVERSFQAASRIITVSDDILQEVVDLKR
jgi:flagellar hook protein FlgE